MSAIVVKLFVLSECVSVCVLFFFSMGHVPEINGDDDDDDTTSYWLACRPIRSQYAATLPAYHLPTVPSVRTQRTIGLCIVSHYPRIHGSAASTGVWLKAEESEISAALRAKLLGKDFILYLLCRRLPFKGETANA